MYTKAFLYHTLRFPWKKSNVLHAKNISQSEDFMSESLNAKNASIRKEEKNVSVIFVSKNTNPKEKGREDFALLNADSMQKWKKPTHAGFGKGLLIATNGASVMEPFKWETKIC